MSWSRNVFSSMISTVAWDDELIITFSKNGAVWAYPGVPEETADQLSRAPSVGQMFLSDIKPQYPGRRIG